MLKRSPSRTQRSKGVKVKHVLQILLLLGVCFWLIYQIKHSHDKKKEYDEKESKVSVRTQIGVENFNLGRKDLPREGVTRSEKPDEEEEEETKGDDEEMKHAEEGQEENKHEEEDHEEENKHEEQHEELQHEEQNKHEEDEQEELDNKGVASEDEGNGGGDDEIDDRDQEKSEETEHDDEFLDEEKEREDGADEEGGGREGEDRVGDIENENLSDDRDLDGGNLNSHEAREEHYKADDASSAVSHDAQTMGSESQKGTLENQKNSEREVLQQVNQSNNIVEDTGVQGNSGLTLGEGEQADNGTSLVLQSSERKGNESSTTERGDYSVSNSTLISPPDDQLVVGNNTLEMSTEASRNSGSSMDASGSIIQNVTEIMNSTQAHNAATTSDNATIGGVSNLQTAELEQANNSTTISDSKQSDSTVPTGIEKGDATASNSSNSEVNVPDDIIRSETTATSEIDSGSSSTTKENPDASQNQKLDPNNEPGRINEDSGFSAVNGTADAIQHEAIDSSDFSIAQDIKNVRLDLDTLPDITTGENNIEDAAAE